MEVETYEEESEFKKMIKKLQSLLKIRKGYVPINMTMGLAHDLKNRELTK